MGRSLLLHAVSAILLGLFCSALYSGPPGVSRFCEAFPRLDVDCCMSLKRSLGQPPDLEPSESSL